MNDQGSSRAFSLGYFLSSRACAYSQHYAIKASILFQIGVLEFLQRNPQLWVLRSCIKQCIAEPRISLTLLRLYFKQGLHKRLVAEKALANVCEQLSDADDRASGDDEFFVHAGESVSASRTVKEGE